jgi:hypothetical protein
VAVHFHILGMPRFRRKGMLKKTPRQKLGEEHVNHIHIDWWSGNATKWPAHASTTGFKTASSSTSQPLGGLWSMRTVL